MRNVGVNNLKLQKLSLEKKDISEKIESENISPKGEEQVGPEREPLTASSQDLLSCYNINMVSYVKNNNRIMKHPQLPVDPQSPPLPFTGNVPTNPSTSSTTTQEPPETGVTPPVTPDGPKPVKIDENYKPTFADGRFTSANDMSGWLRSDEVVENLLNKLGGITEEELEQITGMPYKEFISELIVQPHIIDFNEYSKYQIWDELVEILRGFIDAARPEPKPQQGSAESNAPAQQVGGVVIDANDSNKFASVNEMMSWLSSDECLNSILQKLDNISSAELDKLLGMSYKNYAIVNIGNKHISDYATVGKTQLLNELLNAIKNTLSASVGESDAAQQPKPKTQSEQHAHPSMNPNYNPRFNNNKFNDFNSMMVWLNSDECKNAVFEKLNNISESDFNAHCGMLYGQLASTVGSSHMSNPSSVTKEQLFNEIIALYVQRYKA